MTYKGLVKPITAPSLTILYTAPFVESWSDGADHQDEG